MSASREWAIAQIEKYYAAFNMGDKEGVLSCLSDSIAHDINQGEREVGKEAFRAFLDRMDHAYSEQLSDIVILTSADGRRAAAEFMVDGVYKQADEGFPAAHGQKYRLPAGAFFDLDGEAIIRVSVYYNLNDWISQVS
jgi:steroid delta-isomerase-like uncharacterized protein